MEFLESKSLGIKNNTDASQTKYALCFDNYSTFGKVLQVTNYCHMTYEQVVVCSFVVCSFVVCSFVFFQGNTEYYWNFGCSNDRLFEESLLYCSCILKLQANKMILPNQK